MTIKMAVKTEVNHQSKQPFKKQKIRRIINNNNNNNKKASFLSYLFSSLFYSLNFFGHCLCICV